MQAKSVQLLLFLAAFVSSFAVGFGVQLSQPRLAADPELIYILISLVVMVGFFIFLAIWSAIGPIIYWRRFLTLLFATALAVSFGLLGFYGFPPWN